MSDFPGNLSARPQGVGLRFLLRAQAMGLLLKRTSVLHLRSGHVWVTAGIPYSGPANNWGNGFMTPGQSLVVPAGTSVVLEPNLEGGNQGTARFDWLCGAEGASRFAREVGMPAREFTEATKRAGAAFWANPERTATVPLG